MGGNLNHEFFWESLVPIALGQGYIPRAESILGRLIEDKFGSIDEFKDLFTAKSLGIKGSGWAWLAYNTATESLELVTTVNHGVVTDIDANLVPLLTLDMWEHAFYVNYGP